jgi:GrpB protein
MTIRCRIVRFAALRLRPRSEARRMNGSVNREAGAEAAMDAPAEFVIADHDPEWSRVFEAEATRLRSALGSMAMRIEHHGSTTVPGLAAKPIADIQVSVNALEPMTPYPQRCRQSDMFTFQVRTTRSARSFTGPLTGPTNIMCTLSRRVAPRSGGPWRSGITSGITTIPLTSMGGSSATWRDSSHPTTRKRGKRMHRPRRRSWNESLRSLFAAAIRVDGLPGV